MRDSRLRRWFSLPAGVLLLAAAGSAVQAQTYLFGTWVSSPSAQLGRGPLRSAVPLRGRGIEITVTQGDGAIRVTEDRLAGGRRHGESYTLLAGREQVLNRFGRDETVTVRWDGGSLVIEAAEKWRETWTAGEDVLTIRRESLAHGQRRRTLVLSRRGAAK